MNAASKDDETVKAVNDLVRKIDSKKSVAENPNYVSYAVIKDRTIGRYDFSIALLLILITLELSLFVTLLKPGTTITASGFVLLLTLFVDTFTLYTLNTAGREVFSSMSYSVATDRLLPQLQNVSTLTLICSTIVILLIRAAAETTE